jgi:hypothetical protein
VTRGNGWTGGYTTRIDSNKVITRCYYHIISEIDSMKCYRDTLKDNLIDSINNLLTIVMNENVDSLYDEHCEDCGAYFIKISSAGKLIETQIIGLDEINNPISRFAKFISEIKISEKDFINSQRIFETTKFLIPPPPPPGMKMRKFRPPKE